MEAGKTRRTGAQTRQHILDTAAQVIDDLGMANATTKEIAKAAGCSEATLYKYFTGKAELFLDVLWHRFPPFVGDMARLHEQAGQGSVRDTLSEVLVKAVAFFRYGVPRLGGLFGDPDLLRRHRDELKRAGSGPMGVNAYLEDYLAEEQRLGRIPTAVPADALAALLIGPCFQRGFFEAFTEEPDRFPPVDDFVAALLDGVGVTG